ncbi:substrate-binding domain-containing protein [Pseudonocardia sp. GCM10023141]|uniref:substrate-binding domain-containing protein n=1 Tax=Pseudonocardia sp. GCM10023141 TaxID=3252653 RepID=UPI00360F9EA7
MDVLSAAWERGIAVPAELAVVGFDDIPMAAWPLVGPATVACDFDGLARAAVELLVDEMRSPGPNPVERRIPVALVLRGTRAPPADQLRSRQRSGSAGRVRS